MLYRKIASLIEAHLQSDSNKILLIDGARQVGKTYIVRYVGQKLFENYIEINLVEDALGAGLFAKRPDGGGLLPAGEYARRRQDEGKGEHADFPG